MLAPDIVAFLESGPTILVGTCSAALAPSCGFVLGVIVRPGGLTVHLPAAAAVSADLVADLRATGEIAVTFSRAADHRTLQLKGPVTAVRDGDAADRAAVERHIERWIEQLAHVGAPRHAIARIVGWPCHAVDMQVREIFTQTPGPGAGARWVA